MYMERQTIKRYLKDHLDKIDYQNTKDSAIKYFFDVMTTLIRFLQLQCRVSKVMMNFLENGMTPTVT